MGLQQLGPGFQFGRFLCQMGLLEKADPAVLVLLTVFLKKRLQQFQFVVPVQFSCKSDEC